MFASRQVIAPLLEGINYSFDGSPRLTYDLDGGASRFIVEKLTPAPISKNSYYWRTVNFATDKIVYAGYGGCIAIVHTKSELDDVAPIDIYDSEMQHILALFPPPDMCNASGVQISPDGFSLTPEEMIVMVKGGTLWVFNIRGNLVLKVRIFDEVDGEFVLFTAFYDTGVFIVTTTGAVWHVEDFTKCHVELVTSDDLLAHGASGVAIPPYSGSLKQAHGPILVAPIFDPSDNLWKLAFVQKTGVQVIDFPYPIRRIEFSPSFTQVVVLTEGGVVIYSHDFRECYMKLNLVDMEVRSVVWCGDSHLVAVMDDHVRIIGDAWHPLELPLNGDCFVVSEVDGARIITKDSVYLLREIKGHALDLLTGEGMISDFIRVGSDVQNLAKKSVLKNFKKLIKSATDGILEAAEFFSTPDLCKYLLDVCLRVKPYAIDFDIPRVLRIISEQRILRFITQEPVSMPLTEQQFRVLSSARLILRLCNRNHHLLALRIAEFLQDPVERVYSNWANSLIVSNAPPNVIREKLDACPTGLDYTQLALLAYERQGIDFAIEILRKNKLPSKTVPILVKWGRWSEAMKLALESNDMSLLEYVIRRAELEVQANPSLKKDLDEALKKNKVAMTVWGKLHPDRSMETFASELAAFAENPSKEAFDRLSSMAPTENAKKALKMLKKMNEVCKERQVKWDKTPYAIMDHVILTGTPSSIKATAEALNLEKDELAWRKLEVAAKKPDPNDEYSHKLIREAVEALKVDEIANAMLKFKDDAKSISGIIYHYVPNKLKPDLDQILAQAKSHKPV